MTAWPGSGIVAIWPSQRPPGAPCTLGFVMFLVLGRAETLMSAIPMHDLDEIATKDDVQLSAAALKTDIAGLRAELKTDIADLRTELETDMAQLQRTMIGWMVSLFAATVGAVIGVALLG